MIKTARQLKDKVKNLVGGNNTQNRSQTLIRNFIMERFLERISQSEYRDNFILKGGMLVASLIGLDMRATMDIDTTVSSLPLTMSEAEKIIKEIIDVPLGDGVKFEVLHTSNIMEEHDYPGIRFTLQKRDTVHLIPRFYEILDEVNQSELMERDWNNFKNNSFFVGDLTWQDVVNSTLELAELTIDTQEMTMQSEEEEQEEFGMAMV